MPSLSGLGWTALCLLLLCKRTAALGEEVQCSAAPAGALHPVRGLLERLEAGPGCVARERGDKETHVIAVGRGTNGPGNKVTVLLKPLSLHPAPLRALHLLLSSELPLSWWLEADRLQPDLPVLVQVSSDSSVRSRALRLDVQTVPSLPFRPRALHRWALRRHGNLSSMTHAARGNRVYVALGEDPTQPAVCRLQSVFLSHDYLTSELQPQEVQGCTGAPTGATGPEVHVIKLHSAGSGLCGSLQVEVIVSLVPPVANSKSRTVVLILSSSVPVNWAVVARGVKGHISVHSSNSVSPPDPPEPDLTLSSRLDSDLSTVPDLLSWAQQSGHTELTSYTEAELANRFVIQLAGAEPAVMTMSPVAVRPAWAEQRRLRPWLSAGGRAPAGWESLTVRCEDGRLSVSVDQRVLQSSSVSAVTLRDSTCRAQANGSHFLLVFPVTSCGTEALLLGRPGRVQYKNMVFLWRDEPQDILALNETERKSRAPLSIHISCLAAGPTPPGSADVPDLNTPPAGPFPWAPEGPGPGPGLRHPLTPGQTSAPALLLKLSAAERYEQRVGPCVITADQRVYVEISASGRFIDVLEVKSCGVSPLSDPTQSRFWTVVSGGCSSDASLTLGAKTREEEEVKGGGGDEREEEKEETDGLDRRRREAPERMENSSAEEEIWPLRFSFILRPVYNDSIQFLHCSLRLCVSDPEKEEPTEQRVKSECQDGLRIPPLVSRSPRHQCEIRNLYRPMVVTQPISSLATKLAPKLAPNGGQRARRPSVSPPAGPDPEHSMPTGPVMGIVFTAFVMGVCLMGALWGIYYYTGDQISFLLPLTSDLNVRNL